MYRKKDISAMRLSKKEYVGEDRPILAIKREGKSFAMHSHDYFEIEIVLCGEGRQRINGEDYAINAGTVFILSPADFHEVYMEDGVQLWNISFEEGLLGERQLHQIVSLKNPAKQADAALLERLDAAAELICKESGTRAMSHLLSYILELLFPESEEGIMLDEIKKALLYVQTHFREAPTLCEVAGTVYMSAAYFSNRFRLETGQTYTQYLNRCRIRCAAMLLESNYSVRDACFGSGFSSLSNFLYTFKKYKGCSPEQYKRRHRGESDGISCDL